MKIRNLAVLAVVPLALVTACSSGSTSTGVATAPNNGQSSAAASPSKSISTQDAQLQFAQCMRQNGIDVKDPQPGQPVQLTGNGGDMSKLQAATKACQKYMVGGTGTSPNDPAAHDAMVKFAECMRANGINMPDPAPGGGLQMSGSMGAPDKVQAAQKICQKYLPGAGSTTGGPQ